MSKSFIVMSWNNYFAQKSFLPHLPKDFTRKLYCLIVPYSRHNVFFRVFILMLGIPNPFFRLPFYSICGGVNYKQCSGGPNWPNRVRFFANPTCQYQFQPGKQKTFFRPQKGPFFRVFSNFRKWRCKWFACIPIYIVRVRLDHYRNRIMGIWAKSLMNIGWSGWWTGYSLDCHDY